MGVKEFYKCYDKCVQLECSIAKLKNIQAYYECQYSCEHACRENLF